MQSEDMEAKMQGRRRNRRMRFRIVWEAVN